ncbi:MAG TPA: hypothetical protein VM844_01960 [Miltoncostaeaceae bacterium]|jgi:hypothetical protein|nr:hypothetical protein [Miltoncostaeaceae bacterium]
MTHGHHRRGGRGCGPKIGRGRFNREAMLERLERYQRDLEQETADVADLIRRLKDAPPAGTTEPTTV